MLELTVPAVAGAGKQVDKKWFDMQHVASGAGSSRADGGPTFPVGRPAPAGDRKKKH